MKFTHESPWVFRFGAYLLERFPPVNGLLFLIFYLTASLYAADVAYPLQSWPLNISRVFGFFAVYGFFFHLRVFDEHKDFGTDIVNHPERILQSGLITLQDLKILGFFAVAVECAVSLLQSRYTFVLWIICFLYSILMLREFFVPRWLNAHFFLYAVSHMLIMPLLVFWIASMSIPPENHFQELSLLCLLSFFSGMAFEISRKIKSPQDERDGIMTYSKRFGPAGAAFAAWFCLLVSAVVLGYFVAIIKESRVGLIFLSVFFGLCSFVFLRFVLSKKNAKSLELTSSLFMLAAYLIMILLIWTQTGVLS